MNTTLLVLYASLALGVSFICSLLESVLLSTTNAHISVLQRDGKRSGQIWANLKENDSVKPLTAILTLNTISHTVGALGVGSVVGEDGHSSLAVASSLLTLAMLSARRFSRRPSEPRIGKRSMHPLGACSRC